MVIFSLMSLSVKLNPAEQRWDVVDIGADNAGNVKLFILLRVAPVQTNYFSSQ